MEYSNSTSVRSAPGVEYGVFRLDTGEQVGIGTTDRLDAAEDDFNAWQADGFPVEIRSRLVSHWMRPTATVTRDSDV